MAAKKGKFSIDEGRPRVVTEKKVTIPNQYAFGDKLYIVTRRDLAPGYQAVQSCHAMQQFAVEHETIDRRWFIFSNHLALLSVSGEPELLSLLASAIDSGIAVSAFREPDVGNAITAIALEPGEKTAHLCSYLPLALAGVKQ